MRKKTAIMVFESLVILEQRVLILSVKQRFVQKRRATKLLLMIDLNGETIEI